MARSHWLVKSEPGSYPWQQLVAEKRTLWTGVRNLAARNHLAAMRRGDLVLFYHSGGDRQVVGVARVRARAVPDPTAGAAEGWVAPELAPVKALASPVSLVAIKAEPRLCDLALVRQSRLSVMPLAKPAFTRILAMGRTRLSPDEGGPA